jgi:hypothetical protein
MNRFLFAKHAEDRPLRAAAPQARWLCCSLLTYRTGYASSLTPRLGACIRMRTYFCTNPKWYLSESPNHKDTNNY